MREETTLRLREYREGRGFTQPQAVAAIKRRAKERGDVEPGLDRTALCRHERGARRPSLYYQALYCEVYGATAVQLGFRLALPGESGHPDDVDRREFLASTAGFLVSAALPSAPPRRLGNADVLELRESVIRLYKLGDQHGGAGAVYPLTVRTVHRLHGLVERASYDSAAGQALRQLGGQTAQHAGRLAFDAERHDDARRWWLEAIQWSQRAEPDSVGVAAMASMALQASGQHRPREAVDFAQAAQRTAKRAATPRLKSMLLAREALGLAGARDGPGAFAALRRARALADRPRHDDDPVWLDFYGPADFASHERRIALVLGDTAAAEEAARTALALNDPVAYPRNRALYLVRLADDLSRRGEVDEGVAIANQATIAAADLDSARVAKALRAVTQNLAAVG